MNQIYFKRSLARDGYRPSTVTLYIFHLSIFLTWLSKADLRDIRDVTPSIVLDFVAYLRTKKVRYKGEEKTGYETPTISKILSTVKCFFTYLVVDDKILNSPFDTLDVSMVRTEKRKEAVSVETMEKFLESIDGKDERSIRDRALCELLYATAIRCGELQALHKGDVDVNGRTLHVRLSKNGEGRIVPVSERARFHLLEYVKHSRPVDVQSDSSPFFVGINGKALSKSCICHMIKRRLQDADMEDVKLTAHIFRHSCATHLLENGAGIRRVQEMLGHRRLSSTVIYTHFTVGSRRRMVKMYHPLENELFEE